MNISILAAAAVAATLIAGATQADEVEDLKKRIEKLEKAEVGAKKADWASKISFKGDFRYRHENIDREESATDRTRHRMRARFGLTGKVTDTVKATVRLATGGGGNDPRSTNQTLGDGLDRKDVAIDQAFVQWAPWDGVEFYAGKMPQPWESVGSYFWDGDITPEGGAMTFENGAFFGSAFGFWLSESSSGSDATMSGAQVGMKGETGGVKLKAALGYYDVGAVRNRITTAATGCSPMGAFVGGPQGNTTVSTSGCVRLANDFNLIEALAEAQFRLGAQPFTVFLNYLQNQDASALDTGYSAGFKYGKASNPGTWEFGYAYQSMDKDAQFGQFVDSDFGDGVTDTKGSVVKVAYAPAKNWTLSGTYFMNQRFVDVGAERDYDRLQLDMIFKY